jgi:predicted HAD superfamily Cof-like phosphohydrolase
MEGRIEEKEVNGSVVYLIKRVNDGKQLKSVDFSEPNLEPILNRAEQAEKRASTASADAEAFRRPSALRCVGEFHRFFGLPMAERAQFPPRDRMDLQLNLIEEEVNELRAAFAANDLVEAADALADIQYVLTGAVHEFGMANCFADLFEEVQRSNMSKACATMEIAEKTVEHYRVNKGTEARIEKKEIYGETMYLIKRASDGKQLKSVEFSEPKLVAILAQAGADQEDLRGPRQS